MSIFAGLLIIAVAIAAIVRRVDVRLTLLLAALALGCLAGHPEAIVQKFLTTLVSERFVLPITCALGFVHVLRQTGCDRHLVHLLVRPLLRVRVLLIPGTIVVAALVNGVVISQMSTAVLVGAVLVPLLREARISPVTIGAALLLGSSLGGDLLNPGAPEVRTVSEAARVTFSATIWLTHVAPRLAIELAAATAVFWLLSLRIEARYAKTTDAHLTPERDSEEGNDRESSFRIHPVKAIVPLVPIVLLFLAALPEPFRVLHVPTRWLVDVTHFAGTEADLRASFDCRLIAAAMLIGTAAAALTDRSQWMHTALTFFEGVGFAFARIISLIVSASCFGEGIERIGLAEMLAGLLRAWPRLLTPAACVLPMAFALLCGSGMAATQSLYGLYVGPAHQAGYDPLSVGALVALSASAGRTLSPVAAVTLMCATQVEVDPLVLVRRLVLPILAGLLALLIANGLLG
jgi:DcuC family C4-dicarboxylate transporter